MTIKVELPPGEAERLVREWRERADQLEGELTGLRSAIASAESQLNGKLPLTLRAAELLDKANVTKSGKRRKGENLRVLQNYMKAVSEKGATFAEITKNSGIGLSSVRAVFARHNDIFARGQDGLWRLKTKGN